ncbi:serine/threonine-protein kinase [Singulisphaera sp. Ch08]|uniref:Serine/threonine-protein kinase n=1 Tax=Singulisphaera sp. Ch08 TaxID=3120278 RepID=A0AAU7CHB7_9BACT
MGREIPPDGDRSSRLDIAMAEYLAAADAGEPISTKAWLERHPGLASELMDCLEDHRRIGRIVAPSAQEHARASGQVRGRDELWPFRVAEASQPHGAAPNGTCIQYFGDYELIEVLGRGGMGVVYRARQRSLGRQVALKMIRAGRLAAPDDLIRFRNEAQAVARLGHPHLLTILEVGEHDGRHYFSMPLINGGSLSDSLPRFRANPRLVAQLMAEVAGAVHHAHQRGILHRDLKPANILIDDACRPYVADFGLAKQLDKDGGPTLSGVIVGTPAYMAPEQASGRRGAVTTASDVYGLGAVLYALLAGRCPFPGDSPAEVLRRVCEEEPERPSRLNASADRSLEMICLKCLEKEPRRRYASAESLADDLVRWLENRPISARPAGPWARCWLWCRRKPALAGMVVALALTLVAGATGILMNWLEVRHQKDLLIRANHQYVRERDSARALNEFLVEDLLPRSSPLGAPHRALTVGELLDRSVATVGRRFAGRPWLEAPIRRVLADAYRAGGRLDQAEEQIKICLQLLEVRPGGDERDRLAAWQSMGGLLLDKGRLADAKAYASRAYEGWIRHLGETEVETLDSANLLASVLMALKQPERAEELLRRTLRTAESTLGSGHRTTLASLSNLAVIAHNRGRFEDAERWLRAIRQERIRLFGPDHPETLFASSNLGAIILARRGAAEAESLLGQTLDSSRRVLGNDHYFTLTIANNLASAHSQLGRLNEAGERLAEVVRGRKSALGDAHIDTVLAVSSLAANMTEQGRGAEAVELLRGILPRVRAILPPADPRRGAVLINLAGALREAGSTAEAEGMAAEAVALCRKLPPGNSRTHAMFVNALAMYVSILIANREFERAETAAREVLAARVRSVGTEPWRIASAKSLLGGALAGQGRFVEAEPLLIGGYEGLHSDPGAKPKALADASERLALMYEASGRPEIAARWRNEINGRRSP